METTLLLFLPPFQLFNFLLTFIQQCFYHFPTMKTKKEIVENWLPRYTGRKLEDFPKYILLTNFEYYLELFAEIYGVKIVGADKTMPNVS